MLIRRQAKEHSSDRQRPRTGGERVHTNDKNGRADINGVSGRKKVEQFFELLLRAWGGVYAILDQRIRQVNAF